MRWTRTKDRTKLAVVVVAVLSPPLLWQCCWPRWRAWLGLRWFRPCRWIGPRLGRTSRPTTLGRCIQPTTTGARPADVFLWPSVASLSLLCRFYKFQSEPIMHTQKTRLNQSDRDALFKKEGLWKGSLNSRSDCDRCAHESNPPLSLIRMRCGPRDYGNQEIALGEIIGRRFPIIHGGGALPKVVLSLSFLGFYICWLHCVPGVLVLSRVHRAHVLPLTQPFVSQSFCLWPYWNCSTTSLSRVTDRIASNPPRRQVSFEQAIFGCWVRVSKSIRCALFQKRWFAAIIIGNEAKVKSKRACLLAPLVLSPST